MFINSRNRKFFLFAGILLVSIAFPCCVEEDTNLSAGQGWTSTDFTSIPVRQRFMQAERGNLVRNPSFEYGRMVNVDSTVHSSNITAWQVRGENVKWVYDSSGTESGSAEVRSGVYAIKIYREHYRKKEIKTEGIISDFIRVIPGTYDFSFWIRLSDINPHKVSIGRRMNAGIDIRILFYDKNRLLLGANSENGQESIGHASKYLSFSDFWHIDSLGWTSLQGRTGYNYFTDGDIPDETRFVKLFLGLKGTGTMWIDDVDFRYGRNNFTSLERTLSLADTSFSQLDLIVPTPQHLEAEEAFKFHSEGSDTIPMPLIMIPGQSEKQTMVAATLLKASLDSLFARRFGKDSLPEVLIINRMDLGRIEKGGLVFSLGERADLADVSDPQAYIIRTDTLYHNLIHLSGTSAKGDYYAASTAIQMLDASKFLFYRADIIDYPDIPERAFLISPVAAASNAIDYKPYLQDMEGLKLNWAYLDYYRSKTLWQQESRAYLEGLKIIGREGRSSGMLSLAQMVNPYAYLPKHSMVDSLDKEARERWTHYGAASMGKLKQQYLAGMKAGAKTLVLCADDYLPLSPEGNYMLYSDLDREKYINLQEAHLEMIRSIYSWSRSIDSEVKMEFIPPWYSNNILGTSRGQAEQYLLDLGPKLPEDMRIIWTGPAARSSHINAVDLKRYRELTGRELILMDNTMGSLEEIISDTLAIRGYAMKLRSLNLFDPFSVNYSEPYMWKEGSGKMLVNASLSSEIMKIRIATAADFMWNTDGYEPDLSLYKVLVSRFGQTLTNELYDFSDSYYAALASVISLRNSQDQQRMIKQINEQHCKAGEIPAKIEPLAGT